MVWRRGAEPAPETSWLHFSIQNDGFSPKKTAMLKDLYHATSLVGAVTRVSNANVMILGSFNNVEFFNCTGYVMCNSRMILNINWKICWRIMACFRVLSPLLFEGLGEGSLRFGIRVVPRIRSRNRLPITQPRRSLLFYVNYWIWRSKFCFIVKAAYWLATDRLLGLQESFLLLLIFVSSPWKLLIENRTLRNMISQWKRFGQGLFTEQIVHCVPSYRVFQSRQLTCVHYELSLIGGRHKIVHSFNAGMQAICIGF
jgi:hypothetical protein